MSKHEVTVSPLGELDSPEQETIQFEVQGKKVIVRNADFDLQNMVGYGILFLLGYSADNTSSFITTKREF